MVASTATNRLRPQQTPNSKQPTANGKQQQVWISNLDANNLFTVCCLLFVLLFPVSCLLFLFAVCCLVHCLRPGLKFTPVCCLMYCFVFGVLCLVSFVCGLVVNADMYSKQQTVKQTGTAHNTSTANSKPANANRKQQQIGWELNANWSILSAALQQRKILWRLEPICSKRFGEHHCLPLKTWHVWG